MLNENSLWKLAYEFARSGRYPNVVMIEEELLRRGLLRDAVTTNIRKRELLTRTCRDARDGHTSERTFFH